MTDPDDPIGGMPPAESAEVDSAQGSAPGVPRWVKAIGVIALILIAFVVVQFVLGVQHGPGMHGA